MLATLQGITKIHSFLSEAQLMKDYKSGRLVLLQDRNNTVTVTDDLFTLKERFINVYLNGSLENMDYSYVKNASLPVYKAIGSSFVTKLLA